MVVDSRRVNAITRKDAYPMPLIDDIVFQLGPCKYLATMDAYCGFNQVALHPDSVPKTAFITPFGLFESLRLCFGLTNAPACFMRIMNKVLSEQVGKHAFVYLDDIIVYSCTFEEHVEHLELMFEALRQANLRLNPKKCSFFRSEVTFLGFVFTQEGLEPDPRLLTAISNRQPPRNPKEVASWLGLTGYYRRFVKDYAKVAAPLTDLLKKTNPWKWGAEEQQAFDTLKSSLLTPPCLRRADLSRPFYVHTDASGQAVGAILTQKDDTGKEEWVVAYHSRKLTPAQRNYSISELECLAVIEAVCVQWRQWLWHHPPGVTVYTDHAALKYLLTSTHLQGRLARWSLRLQELLPGLAIEHRKGTMHRSVDALTRDPTFDSDDGDEASIPHPRPEIYCYGAHLLDEIYTVSDTECNTECPPDASAATAGTTGLTVVTATATTAAPTTAAAALDDVNDARTPQGNDSPRTPTCNEELAADDNQLLTPAPASYLPWRPGVSCKSAGASPVRIYIDGNIGSGKSRVIAHLAQELSCTEWHLVPEPVHDWESLLAPFYSAAAGSTTQQGIAALLQVAVLVAYAKATPDALASPMVVMERGPWSSLEVFLAAQQLPAAFEQLAESSVKSILRALQASLDRAEDWDVKLPWVLLGLRSAPHSTTKCTPFEAAMARTPRLPADVRRLTAAEQRTDTAAVPNTEAAVPDNLAAAGNSTPATAARVTGTPFSAQTAAAAAAMTTPADDDDDDWWQHLPASWQATTAFPSAATPGAAATSSAAVAAAAAAGAAAAAAAAGAAAAARYTTSGINLDGFTTATAAHLPGAAQSPPIDLTNSQEPAGDLLIDIKQRAASRQDTLVKVEKNILASQEKQKRDFRKRHHVLRPDSVIKVGDLCLMKTSQYTKMHKKLSTEGPFYLAAYSPDFKRAVLQDNDNRQWSVSVTRLAPYTADTPKQLLRKPGAAAE
uniref:Reverse transcriptase domain-containing protein n=1 Tax=Tetradesmus obliquus TaxID=3088 RepID=A0A383VGW9_TETOB